MYNCFLNNIIVWSHLFAAQATLFKMTQDVYVHVNHAHLYNWSAPLTMVVLNNCYSEVMAYIALAYFYWANFHDMHGC